MPGEENPSTAAGTTRQPGAGPGAKPRARSGARSGARAGGESPAAAGFGAPIGLPAISALAALIGYELIHEIGEIFFSAQTLWPWQALGLLSVVLLGAALTWLLRRLIRHESGLAKKLATERVARERAERAVTSGREAWAALIEALPDLFFQLERDGTIVDYRAPDPADLYRQPSDFLGRRMQDVLPPDVARQFDRSLARLAAGENLVHFEYALPMSGGERFFEARMVPLSERHVVVTLREISARRRAERALDGERRSLEQRVAERTQELEDSQAKLREAERLASLGTLAAGIAHQLNNPLGSILAASQFAQRYQDEPDAREVARDALETVIAESTRCGRIVKELLKLSRGEPTRREPVDPRSLLYHCVDMCTPYAGEKGVRIAPLRIESNPTIEVSTLEIEEALVNLIRNAIEASPPRGVVEVAAALRDDEVVVIEVRDEGSGMNGAQSSRALDPLFTTRLTEGGTGLGLSVAHRVAQAHGGRLRIESVPGGGSCVQLELPLTPNTASAGARPAGDQR